VLLTGTISNTGTASTQNAFSAGVFLSRNAHVTTTDAVVDSFTVGAINPGNSIAVSRTVRLSPTLLPGSFFLGLIANTPESIVETTLADNSASAPVRVVAGPDLVVQSALFSPS